ncbi:MAG: hypothetical protein P8J86_11470 [Phycisphaerales bacterium]|nr:hypothetical protein [Phycisphaerales bacterium]
MVKTYPIPPTSALILALLVPVMVISAHLMGRQDAPANSQTTANKQLESVPIDIPLLGFSIQLPKGTQVERQQSPAGLTYQFLASSIPAPTSQNPNASMRPWSLRAQVVQSSNIETTGPQLISEIIAAHRQAGANLTNLATIPFTVDRGERATLDYFEQQLPEGPRVIWGYTAIPIHENHFLLLTLLLSPETYQPYRSLLESSLNTITRTSKAASSLGLRACITRGDAFLASLTPERLKKLAGLRQWVRIYRPATTSNGADQEIGYALLKIEIGSKESVQTGDKHNNQEEGLLVTVQARVIVDADRDIYRDSIGLYWMAWNQSEEIWSVRGTQRQGAAELSEAESGLRLPPTAGKPRPELIVIRQGRESNTRTPSQWTVPDVYLSQPLGWLLGRLLPTTAEAEGEYCFYFYDYTSTTPTLSRRIDHWAPSNNRSGQWILTTRLNPTATPNTARYSDQGILIEQRTADGVVTVPVTSAELDRIWNDKKLRR